MCPDCQHERLWNLVLWGVDGGCAHRAHHHHAAVKCAQCALVCNPQFADDVAKRASRNIAEADLVRHTLDCILEQTSVATHHVLLLGDVNAAPIGGRWGYSNRNPALHQVDLKTLEWVRTSGLTEVADEPLHNTWSLMMEAESATEASSPR